VATRTRNRSSRLAVLDTSVRRPASSPLTSRSRSPYRRRIVVVGLAVLSLALITISFRETSSGPAYGFQNAAATALRPFEIAADRVVEVLRRDRLVRPGQPGAYVVGERADAVELAEPGQHAGPARSR